MQDTQYIDIDTESCKCQEKTWLKTTVTGV